MARKIKPATARQVSACLYAISLLKQARHALKVAGAVRTAAKVRSALRSADGALRHVKHRANISY